MCFQSIPYSMTNITQSAKVLLEIKIPTNNIDKQQK